MTPKELFDKFDSMFPIISRDVISYKRVNNNAIELKLKNRNYLIFSCGVGKEPEWTLQTRESQNIHRH